MLGFSALSAAPLADDGAVQSVEMTVHEVVSGNPSVENLVVTQAHDLTADTVVSGSPSVDQTTAAQTEALQADTISSGAPSIETTALLENTALSISDLATGPPIASSVSFAQIHNFTATAISIAAPNVDSISVAELNELAASSVTAQNAQVSSTSLQILSSAPAFNDVDDKYLVKYYEPNQYTTGNIKPADYFQKTFFGPQLATFFLEGSSVTDQGTYFRQYVTIRKIYNPVFGFPDEYRTLELRAYKYTPSLDIDESSFVGEVGGWSTSKPSGRTQLLSPNANRANTDNRYVTLVPQSDGYGWDVKSYENSVLQSTDQYWTFSIVNNSIYDTASYSVLDGRGVFHIFKHVDNSQDKNHFTFLDVWTLGTHDQPAPDVGFTAAPLAGTPTVGDAALLSPLSLAANDVIATAPVVDIASATIESDTNAQTGDVETGNPVVDSAAASVVYNFATANLVSGAVDLDTANMAEDETFTTANVFAGAFDLPTLTVSQDTFLTAQDIETGSPVLGQTNIVANSEIVGNDVNAGFFDVGIATMSEAEALNTNDLYSGVPSAANTTATEYWSLEPQLNGGYDHDAYLRYYDPNYGVLDNVVIDDLNLNDARIKEVRVGPITEYTQYWQIPILFSVEQNSDENIGFFSSTISLYKGGYVIGGIYIDASSPNLEYEGVESDGYEPTNWSSYTAMGPVSLQPYYKRNDGNRNGNYVSIAQKSGNPDQLEWVFADSSRQDIDMSIVDTVDNFDYMELFDGRAVLYVVRENDGLTATSDQESFLSVAAFNVGYVDPPASPTVIQESPLAGVPVVDSVNMVELEQLFASDVNSGAFFAESTPLQEIDPAPSLNAGKTGRDILRYFTPQSDGEPIDYDDAITSLDASYYQYEDNMPYASSVRTYSDRWEQDITAFWYRSANQSYIRRKFTVTVYKHGQGYSDENALVTGSISTPSNFSGMSQTPNLIERIDSSMTQGDGRYYFNSGDFTNFYNADGSFDRTVDRWQFPYRTSGGRAYSILNGRAAVIIYAAASAGNTNNNYQAVSVELWNNGLFDAPAPITEIIGAPLAGTPVVDDVNMTTEHDIEADDLVANAHAVSTTFVFQEHDLSADDFLSQSFEIDDAILTGNHSIVCNNTDSGVPVVEQSLINQNQDLSAFDVASGNPICSPATIDQDETATPLDVTSGAPILDTCNMSEAETFNTSNLYSGASIVDAASPSIIYDLEGDDCISGDVFIAAAVLTEFNDLVTENIITPSPVVGEPIIRQVDQLFANDITTNAPDLPTSNMVEDETFNTSNVYATSAVVQTADISQDEDIDAFSVTAQNVRIDSAAASINYGFDVDGVTAGNTFVQSPDLIETAGLSIADFDFGVPSVPTANMAEAETFSAPDVISGAISVEVINLIEEQDLVARDCVSRPVLISSTEIDQDHKFIPSNVSSGVPSVDTATIKQLHFLDGDGFDSGAITVATPTIRQDETLETEAVVFDVPTVEQTTVGQDEFIEPQDLLSGVPFARAAQVVALYEQTPRSITSGEPVVDDVSMSEDETFSTSDISLGVPFVENTEFLYSRKAGMTDSRNSVIVHSSKNIVDLASTGRNQVVIAADGENTVE